jgi:hypothetical protein
MAAVNLTSNTYAGKRYAEYFTPAMLQEKGIANRNLVTLVEGFKSKAVMTTADISIELKNKASLFAAQDGALQRGEKVMTLVDYSANIQLDYLPVAKSWEAEMLPSGSLDDYQPRELYDFTINNLIVPKLGKLNEQLYILGKAGVSQYGSATFSSSYAGILGKLEAGSDVLKYALSGVASATQVSGAIVNGTAGTATIAVTSGAAFKAGDQITITAADGNQQINGTTIVGQTVTVRSIASNVLTINEVVTGASAATAGVIQFINAGNVIEVLTYIYGLIPETERLKETTRILVSSQVEKFYRQANATQANGSGLYLRSDYFGQDAIPFLDMKIESMPFWKPNSVAVWNPSNVFLAVDLLSDEVSANINWMGDVTNDMVYRFRNDMKSEIDYLFGSEILWVRPA